MNEILTAISTGFTAFTATNIDDIVILLLFFIQVNSVFRRHHIILGQYLGFTALVVASLPGFFGSFLLPKPWIGLLGILPIAIGISRLFNAEDNDSEAEVELPPSPKTAFASFLSPQTYSVAAVTMANGSDNISIYVPLFASSTGSSLLTILSVFFALVGVWCYAAYKLTNLRTIAELVTTYGNQLVPFILMGLGILILVKSGTLENPSLTLLTIIACGFCLIRVNKFSNRELEEN